MSSSASTHRATLASIIGALGVVFGDIGTSPLYAVKESLRAAGGVVCTQEVLGVVSLIFWCILLVVSLKYVTLITRIDNQGEGGILALLALLQGRVSQSQVHIKFPILLCLFGAALLYGDAVITPAISVLSAVEGLEVSIHGVKPFILPITLVILIGIFFIQKYGTSRIGSFFGPVMLTWFTVLGALGIWSIIQNPIVLWAVNPWYAIQFTLQHGLATMYVLACVFLAVTGAEALYADMGHFGRPTIVRAWHLIVFPGLVLNYLGQGALVLRDPSALQNPFFNMVPQGWPSLMLVILSTFATIIASQALISGVFSLTRQAVQLGYFPRLLIQHTSANVIGQIYIPMINWLLGLACIGVVLFFKSSENLVAAYGIAVSATMVITTIAFALVLQAHWRYPILIAWGGCALLLMIDGVLFSSSLHKFLDGGYIPICIALSIFGVMYTWKIGRTKVADILSSQTIDMSLFVEDIHRRAPHRVEGTAIFMTGRPNYTPSTLLHFFKHTHVLHRQIVLLHIATDLVPTVNQEKRVELQNLGEGVWCAIVHYGFIEEPNALQCVTWIQEASQGELNINMQRVSYIFNREIIIGGGKSGLWKWQKALFNWMCQLARPARDYFKIPPNQIVELSTPIHL